MSPSSAITAAASPSASTLPRISRSRSGSRAISRAAIVLSPRSVISATNATIDIASVSAPNPSSPR